jgi:membrane-bound serine protease (ClpP class)
LWLGASSLNITKKSRNDVHLPFKQLVMKFLNSQNDFQLNGSVLTWTIVLSAFYFAPWVEAKFPCAVSTSSLSVDEDAQRPERPATFKRPGIIEFRGPIDTNLTRYFNNRLERAKRDGVDLLIIEIESPGGLKFESLELASKLTRCDWAYTIAFIPREAISGGALVALGCDEIIIAPDAKFGNIGEIAVDWEAMAFRLIRPKVESSLSHDARELAKAKGRPEDLAEAFVDKDVLVYRKPNGDGRFEYRQARVEDVQQPGPPWELIPETRPERFMTLSGKRAVELELADHLAADRGELAKMLAFEPQSFRVYQYSTNDAVVHWLNKPFITGLIIVIGLIALYIELTSPGLGAGGLIAGFCMLLFFWSRYLGGTAGWLEILLFAAGLVFLLMEIFVIPGFGISGFMGIVLLFVSVILAGQNFVVPSTADEWNRSINSTLILLGSIAVFIVAASFLSRHLGSVPLFNRLILQPPPLDAAEQAIQEFKSKPALVEHPQISVGDWGKAESLLRPAGRARFAGRSFDVISDGTFIESGTQVKVVRINGNVITVARAEDEDS